MDEMTKLKIETIIDERGHRYAEFRFIQTTLFGLVPVLVTVFASAFISGFGNNALNLIYRRNSTSVSW